MFSPDRISILGNLFVVLPMLLFLPGFNLTKTFIRLPADAPLLEKLFIRLFLSFVLSSLFGFGITAYSLYSNVNIVFPVIIFSFVCLVLKRFRVTRTPWNFHLVWDDLFAVLIIMGGFFLLFRPSEDIGSVFTMGAYISRMGKFPDYEGVEGLRHLIQNGAFGSIWFAVINTFFGVKLSLLTIPVISIFSLLAAFYLVKRISSSLSAVCTVLFLVTNFTNLWYSRLSEPLIISQFLIIGALYLTHLYLYENQLGYIVIAGLSLIESVAIWPGAWTVALLWFFIFFVQQVFAKKGSAKFPLPLKQFIVLLVVFDIVFATQESSGILWAFPAAWWILFSAGIGVYSWKEARIKDLLFLIPFSVCPLLMPWMKQEERSYIENLSILVPIILPSIMIWSGVFFGFLSRIGRVAYYSVILSAVALSAVPVYLNWNLIMPRDCFGLLKFYETLSRSFLGDDLVFSDDPDLSSLMWRLYGLKVYVIEPEGLDRDFDREIRNWLKQGGHAFVMTRGSDPKMEGFDLKIQNVERLRTKSLEKSFTPPENQVLQEIIVKVYQANPK